MSDTFQVHDGKGVLEVQGYPVSDDISFKWYVDDRFHVCQVMRVTEQSAPYAAAWCSGIYDPTAKSITAKLLRDAETSVTLVPMDCYLVRRFALMPMALNEGFDVVRELPDTWHQISTQLKAKVA